MDFFDSTEESRANALIATFLDGYEGSDISDGMAFLLTDVDDWEHLAVSLAGRAATLLIVLAGITELDPYTLWERCVA